MAPAEYENDRFKTETGVRVIVQVPETHVQKIMDAILAEDALTYGDYDSVAYQAALGQQQFRSTGRGRNASTPSAVKVPCVEVSFFLSGDASNTTKVLKAIYETHPYEEPVILVSQCLRTLHIRGLDEDNPNRFWNGDAEEWVPEAHQPKSGRTTRS
ncbi:hypothetical protein [uncultured Ruegeria sp.]|uniref:hypothetical protein n=1 Tax=uncultured Ruegeria sp. TaxID=259304 RepID=UPI00262E14EB|nr:hypothetical protein [uncultured Ruegeria sp.]